MWGKGRAGPGLTYIPPLTRTDSTWLLKPSAWRLRTSLFSSISFPSKHSSPCRKMEGSEKNCGMGAGGEGRRGGKQGERAPVGAGGIRGWRASTGVGTGGEGGGSWGFLPQQRENCRIIGYPQLEGTHRDQVLAPHRATQKIQTDTHHRDLLQGADGGRGQAAHGAQRRVLALGQHVLLPGELPAIEQDPAGGEDEPGLTWPPGQVGVPCPPSEPPRVPTPFPVLPDTRGWWGTLCPSPCPRQRVPGCPTCPHGPCRIGARSCQAGSPAPPRRRGAPPGNQALRRAGSGEGGTQGLGDGGDPTTAGIAPRDPVHHPVPWRRSAGCAPQPGSKQSGVGRGLTHPGGTHGCGGGCLGALTCRMGCAEAMRQSAAPQSSQLRYTPFSRTYCSPEKLGPS